MQAEKEMGIAPGGLIKQCILEDKHPPSIWKKDQSVCFNIQILDSQAFRRITGRDPPATPITAKTYAKHGLPFYEIYNETSSIKGDFQGIKSVKAIDKGKAVASSAKVHGKRKRKDDDEDEESFKNPIISLKEFRPVSELKADLTVIKNVQF